MAASVDISGLLSRLSNSSINGARMASAIIQSTGDQIVADAKASAPADLGQIRQGIGKQNVTDDGLQISVFANAPHSAYMEFGTGPQVDVPEDMADIAAQFQGANTGTWADFILALTDWVKRHGINPIGTYQISTHTRISRGSKTDVDQQTAYMIARSILKKGLAPHPFLYPAWIKYTTELPAKLQTALQEAVRTA